MKTISAHEIAAQIRADPGGPAGEYVPAVAALPKSITILGRRWFEKTNGNTYHSATAIVDGEVKARIDFAYGYGDQYLHNAFAALEQGQVIPARDREKTGFLLSPWTHCDDLGIALHYEATDVARKKDL